MFSINFLRCETRLVMFARQSGQGHGDKGMMLNHNEAVGTETNGVNGEMGPGRLNPAHANKSSFSLGRQLRRLRYLL